MSVCISYLSYNSGTPTTNTFPRSSLLAKFMPADNPQQQMMMPNYAMMPPQAAPPAPAAAPAAAGNAALVGDVHNTNEHINN